MTFAFMIAHFSSEPFGSSEEHYVVLARAYNIN